MSFYSESRFTDMFFLVLSIFFQSLEEQLKGLKHKVEENNIKNETVEKAEAIEAYNKKLLTEIALLQKEKLQTEGELSDVQKHLLMVKADIEDQSRIWEAKFNELKWHLLGIYKKITAITLSRLSVVYLFLSNLSTLIATKKQVETSIPTQIY